jgi:hypothetical protein
MARTVEEIFVSGRTPQEVRDEVFRWFGQNQVETMENSQDYVKGRWGVGLATAPKYFQVYFAPAQGGVTVRTEGWIGVYGVSEQSFSSSAVLGGIPRREGWHAMERLWATLRAMSRITRVCPQCGMALSENVNFCQYCGKKLV